jgi:hypothetical protein
MTFVKVLIHLYTGRNQSNKEESEFDLCDCLVRIRVERDPTHWGRRILGGIQTSEKNHCVFCALFVRFLSYTLLSRVCFIYCEIAYVSFSLDCQLFAAISLNIYLFVASLNRVKIIIWSSDLYFPLCSWPDLVPYCRTSHTLVKQVCQTSWSDYYYMVRLVSHFHTNNFN